MAAPTSTNEVTARKLSASISALWAKIKSTFQTLGNLVTTSTGWGSTPSDTKYPSEKLVKTSIDSSVLYANQKWGGAFRISLSPIDVFGMMGHNVFLGAFASCIKVEYSTDGGTTWLDYGLTDTQKMTLFSQFNNSGIASCGKNTHIQPGYTGTIVGTKDLTNENIANQRLRITISSRPFANEGTTSRTGEFAIITRIRRLGILMSTQSASAGTHCVISTRSTANFEAGNDVWATHGDFAIKGDSGWNSIPCDNGTAENGFTFGGYGTGGAAQYNEIRFEIWSSQLNANPASSQTGNLAICAICGLADKINSTNSKFHAFARYGYNCTSVDLANGYPVFGNGIKFAARKLKTNLARTADSTFDGSADQENIPVTGTLPVGNGGTGRTSVTAGYYLVGNGTSALIEKTPNTAANDLINALSTGDATPTGEDYYVAQFAGGGTTTKTYHRRPIKALWEYIKAQISSVLGLTATSYGGNASTATALSAGADRTKLDGIAEGAEVNVQSDWNQATTTADDYIKNKPTLGTAAAKDVPTSGNASTTQVVMGNDSRLTDSRTPTAHTHTADAADVVDQPGDSTITDSTDIITTHVNGYSSTNKKLYKRNFKDYVWPWIKDKISSVLGLSTTGYTGNAATASAAQSGSALETAINGKMNTSASNASAPSGSGGDGATATLLNNLTEGNSDIVTTDDGDNVLIATTDNGGSVTNKWYKRKLVKLIPWIIKKLGTRLVYDCGAGSTSGDDFDAALAAFNAGQWVIIRKDGNAYHCVGSYSGPGLRFKQIANDASLLKVNTLSWTRGSSPSFGTQIEASLSGHTHTRSDITNFAHTHGNIQNSGALQTNDVTIASGDKLVITDSSDSNKVARASASFDGSTTTKALTKKGTFETFMTPSAGNAASGALQNLTAQLTEGTSNFTDKTEIFTSYAGNNGFAESGHVNQPYRRKASSMLNYVRDGFAIARSPADVGTLHKRISLGYGEYNSSAVGAATYLVHLFFNYADDGGLQGKGITVLVTYDFRKSSLQKAECRILSDNGVRDSGYNIVLANYVTGSGDNSKLYICIGLVKNSAPTTLVAFAYSYCKIFKLCTIGDWTQDISSDAVSTYDYIIQATDLVSNAVNADMVDGKHIVIGSWAGASNTIYFG